MMTLTVEFDHVAPRADALGAKPDDVADATRIMAAALATTGVTVHSVTVTREDA